MIRCRRSACVESIFTSDGSLDELRGVGWGWVLPPVAPPVAQPETTKIKANTAAIRFQLAVMALLPLRAVTSDRSALFIPPDGHEPVEAAVANSLAALLQFLPNPNTSRQEGVSMLKDSTYDLMETATVISKGLHRYDTFKKDAQGCQQCQQIWDFMRKSDDEQLQRIVRHLTEHMEQESAAIRAA
jgi:hypothetical protein